MKTTTLFAAIAASSLPFTTAFWRMQCSTSQTGRVDPIISPGQVSSHVHRISGGSNINVNSTYESMQESACTTCEIGADKSGYWTPLLYYEHANGTFEEVPNGGTVVYYLGRGSDIANAVPFPKGFQMVSGTPLARSYDNETMTWGNDTYPGRPVSDRTSFVCIGDYSKPGKEQLVNMDFDAWGGNQECVNGMRAQIQFPSCWDGVNLYKADGSHVAYLSQIDNGVCPPGYPVTFMHLFFEMYYSVALPQFVGGRFVFAFGDPTGYGFHGDFLNGWDLDVLEAAIEQCAVGNPEGSVGTCPPLAVSDTAVYEQVCPENSPFGIPVIDEPVHGLIDKLPGCINIVDGPESATLADIACPADAPSPTINSSPEQTPYVYLEPTSAQAVGVPGFAYVDCISDLVNWTRSLTQDTLQTPNMTIETCQTFCSSKGWRFAGLEYSTQCYCGSNFPLNLGGQNCNMPCAGNSPTGAQEICGGPNLLSVYNNTLSTATFAAPGAGATPDAAGVYVGCYSEATSGRTLSAASTTSPNMTLEYCRTFCSAGGYAYAGSEYSDECYCGNTFDNGGTLLSSNASCNMLCAGDNMQTCGGPNRLSVFSVPSLQCPTDNGTNLTIGPDTFQLTCATDFAGGDMAVTNAASVYDCAAACSNTTGCIASSWIPGSPTGPCYMKGALGAALPNSNVWGLKKLNAVTTHTCPADNGANITVGAAVFSLQCNTDHAGGDLAAASAISVDACAAACAGAQGCVAASFVPGFPGSCYMKSVVGEASANGNVWALVLAGASTGAPTATAAATATAMATTAVSSATATATGIPTILCPSSDNVTYTLNTTSLVPSNSSSLPVNTTTTTTFLLQCDTDHPGNAGMVYTPTMYDCLAACANMTGCTDVSYVAAGGLGTMAPCYLKTGDVQRGIQSGVGAAQGVWGAAVVNQTMSATGL